MSIDLIGSMANEAAREYARTGTKIAKVVQDYQDGERDVLIADEGGPRVVR